jgi:hypothetical protein
MAEKSTVYVRTDKRDFTRKTTIEVLKKYFPDYRMETSDRPLSENTKTQTQLFGDKSIKPGEIDIILTK